MEFAAEVLAKLKFDGDGLIPAVVQEAASGQVLMVAYMNRESLLKTLATGQTWFWSRSRQELWWKGATSGHFQEVQEITADCDYDTLLIQVDQVGGIACHEGVASCFHNPLTEPEPAIMRRGDPRVTGAQPSGSAGSAPAAFTLDDLVRLIRERKEHPQGDSYTCRLFSAGLDRICRKVGEEASEVIIAAKNEIPEELASEAADLVYHLLVLLAENDVPFSAVLTELSRRHSAGHGGDGRGGERVKLTP